MTDVAAYIPVVNRPDLLQQAVTNAWEAWDDLTIIDNSVEGMAVEPESIKVHRGLVPMSYTQSMNWGFADTLRKGKKFCLHMHSDSIVPEGAIEKLMSRVREIDASGKKWGVVYTYYDVLCVFNAEAAVEIGGFDTNFHAYHSDNDFYYRMELAGYERFQTEHNVQHHGSQTINSDPYLKFVTSVTFPLSAAYFENKWGGPPGKEKFKTPFNL